MQPIKKTVFLLLMAIMLCCLPTASTADDNEIFGVVTKDLEPNILLIIDNSGSMKSEVDLEEEVCEMVTYPIRSRWSYCPGTKTYDSSEGQWYCTEERCYDTTSRMNVAKDVVKDIIDDHGATNRFGIMHFNNSEGGHIPKYGIKYATCSVKDSFILDTDGDLKTGVEYDTAIADYKNFLKSIVDGLTAETWTPLAETLFEAGRYFAGEASMYNTSGTYYPTSGNYPDKAAIGYRCRKNYIIFMTDGQPTYDHSIGTATINGKAIPASNDYLWSKADDWGGDIDDDVDFYKLNQPSLSDVAGFLYENDINGFFNETDYTQNITTYTIGFSDGVTTAARLMLQDAADRGNGKGNTRYVNDGGLFFYATSPGSLAEAFETIIFTISEQATFFAAATVPISDVNKAYSGDYAYMAMFQPQSGASRWIGNLKKYYLNDDLEFASCDDQTPILNANGQILDTATSCWTNMDDGGAVDMGGAGQILSEMLDSARHIYSNISGSALTGAANAFSTTNTSLTPALLGLATTEAKNALINEIRMVDEDWKLGDLNHSRPGIASYGSGDSASKYIFVGSNDGMLHCFNDANGSETWAFVPKEQFTRLYEAYTGDHSYFMDGSPTIADTTSKKIVICGERRGGNNYYAIDISAITSPQYLYTKTMDGQSWCQPQFMTVATGASATAQAFLLTGGYDIDYDSSNAPSGPDGSSVIAINAEGGSELWRFDSDDISAMTHSIVSAFAADVIDDGKNIFNQIYAGDLGGNMFAFRDNNNAANPKALDGNWQKFHLFSAGTGKKIFGEADFVQEYIDYYDATTKTWKTVVGDYVFFGTGNRAHPLSTGDTDYFYCVKNDWRTGNIDISKTVADFATLNDSATSVEDAEKVMLDVTDNKIQDGTAEEKKAAQEALNKQYNRGWYIELEHKGEKCLSTPTVYSGVVYFTTFTPDEGLDITSDPCVNPSGGGTARLYAINYKTGGAVYNNFDGDEDPSSDLNKEDRFKVLKAEDITIAPDPLMIISDKGEKLSIGPTTEDVNAKSGVQMFYWMQQ